MPINPTQVRPTRNRTRPAVAKRTSNIEFFDRRVGRVVPFCLSGLQQGTQVHVVAIVSPGVYLVSHLPETEVRRIVE